MKGPLAQLEPRKMLTVSQLEVGIPLGGLGLLMLQRGLLIWRLGLVLMFLLWLWLESPCKCPHVPQLDLTRNVGETDILTRIHHLYIYFACSGRCGGPPFY